MYLVLIHFFPRKVLFKDFISDIFAFTKVIFYYNIFTFTQEWLLGAFYNTCHKALDGRILQSVVG